LNLPPDTDIESVRRKLAYDLYYARRAGLWLDLRIILSTGLLLVGVPSSVSARALRLCPPALDIDAVEIVSTSAASRSRPFETAAVGVE
jgi:Bacterial sugar transferase